MGRVSSTATAWWEEERKKEQKKERKKEKGKMTFRGKLPIDYLPYLTKVVILMGDGLISRRPLGVSAWNLLLRLVSLLGL